jgi:hypothetical protein
MKFNCNCDYCKKNTFIWSINSKIIWIEIPKNGSYNLKTIKFKYDSETPDDFTKTNLRRETLETISNFNRAFVILRNPIERFTSLISHYFIDGGRAQKGFGKRWLDLIGVNDYSHENLIEIVLTNFDKIGLIEEPHHFNTQKSFIPEKLFDSNLFFMDLSELDLFFSLNKKLNTSDSSRFRLTDNQFDKIKNLYIEDWNLYKNKI